MTVKAGCVVIGWESFGARSWKCWLFRPNSEWFLGTNTGGGSLPPAWCHFHPSDTGHLGRTTKKKMNTNTQQWRAFHTYLFFHLITHRFPHSEQKAARCLSREKKEKEISRKLLFNVFVCFKIHTHYKHAAVKVRATAANIVLLRLQLSSIEQTKISLCTKQRKSTIIWGEFCGRNTDAEKRADYWKPDFSKHWSLFVLLSFIYLILYLLLIRKGSSTFK